MEDLNSSDTFSVKKHLIPSQLQTITVILALHPAEMMKARAPYPPPPLHPKSIFIFLMTS